MAVMIIPVLEGCWNQEELTDLALVMALGIDKGPHNQGYQLTYEIVNPGNVATGQMGGGQGSPVAVYKSTGATILEASRKATKKLSRRPYYAHTNVLVINEKVAKEGILNMLDFFERDPVFRSTTQIMIAKGAKAETVVSTLTIMDKLPVYKMVKALEVTEERLGENTRITVDDFISSLVSTGKEPFANGIILPGKKANGYKMSNIQSDMPEVIIALDGLAIFKDGKLVDWIDGKNARAVVWLLKKVKSTAVFISWQGKKKAIGTIIRRSKTDIKAKIKNGKPVIYVKVKAEGDIDEADTAVDLTNPDTINKIEDKMGKEIQSEIRSAIKTLQQKKSDIVGFGEYVHRDNPKTWKKLENNWDESFSNLEVNVTAKAFLRRSGHRTKPFSSDFKPNH